MSEAEEQPVGLVSLIAYCGQESSRQCRAALRLSSPNAIGVSVAFYSVDSLQLQGPPSTHCVSTINTGRLASND